MSQDTLQPLSITSFGASTGYSQPVAENSSARFLFSLLLMVELCDMNEYLAQFLGLFVYGAVNFSMNKRLTFFRK